MKQLELMKQICSEYENDHKSDSDRFQKVFAIVKEMKDCGSPPEELTGHMPDFDFPNIELDNMEALKNDKGCSLM